MYVCMYICIYMYVCMYTFMYMYMYIFMCLCILHELDIRRIPIFILFTGCIYTHTYTYIRTAQYSS